MNKNEILSILNDWNFWKQELDIGILRTNYLNRLHAILKTGQIIVIKGPRRAGKSYIMKQFAKQLIDNGTPSNEILMINFEDPRFGKLDTKLMQEIFEVYLEFLNPKSKPYIFLDEVQEVDEWEKWVRTMHELGKANIILSGSNAKLLSRELSTLLTGLHVGLTVLPLSFCEYLLFKKIDLKDDLDIERKRIELSRMVRESLEFGLFPKVVLSEEKKEILLAYYDDIVSKDIIKRFKIRKPEQLKSLSRFYFSNSASLVTYNSIEKFLNITASTIEKFSSYLEETYLCFFLKRFSFKVKEQEKSPRKVYAIDPGLANVVGFRLDQNIGKLAELMVFLELARIRETKHGYDIYYWKDVRHREVDFVIKEEERISHLIQVCWDISAPQTKEREIKSLIKGMEELHVSEGLIITETYEDTEHHDDKIIKYIPLWKWLLNPF
ncbi:MAG: ATP-binding protein [Pseudomonadota bacterium]